MTSSSDQYDLNGNGMSYDNVSNQQINHQNYLSQPMTTSMYTMTPLEASYNFPPISHFDEYGNDDLGAIEHFTDNEIVPIEHSMMLIAPPPDPIMYSEPTRIIH